MGKLWVLEGIDGCGKTTQLGLLCAKLDRASIKYNKLEFPRYDSESSSLVRMYLGGRFGADPDEVGAYAASSFYAVDRCASYLAEWGEKYRSGELFVAGRYTTSNAIHQGAKLEGEERRKYMDWLFDYEYRLLELPEPDKVILLDVPEKVSVANIAARKRGRDIHEKDADYICRCRKSALEAAQRFGWRIVDCAPDGIMRPADDISLEVAGVLEI